MNGRCHNRYRTDAITAGLEQIPEPMLPLVEHARFVCGADPVFIGLHGHEVTIDGRSYRGTAHCCYPFHIVNGEQVSTVVLPLEVEPWTVVHELGHVLHERLAFDASTMGLTPVTSYAALNDHEAFAEAFTAWCLPDVYPWARDYMDERTVALFDGLSPKA